MVVVDRPEVLKDISISELLAFAECGIRVKLERREELVGCKWKGPVANGPIIVLRCIGSSQL